MRNSVDRGAVRSCRLPIVHETVEKWIVHGITHGEEVADQVDVGLIIPFRNGFVHGRKDEVQLLRKPEMQPKVNTYTVVERRCLPTETEYENDGDEHFNDFSLRLNGVALPLGHFSDR